MYEHEESLIFCSSLNSSVENPSTLATAFDISLEIEVQTVWCCHLEAKIPEEEVISPVHHWDHVLYLALLILKVIYDLLCMFC